MAHPPGSTSNRQLGREILLALYENRGTTSKELGEAVGVPHNVVTNSIIRYWAWGYVGRRKDREGHNKRPGPKPYLYYLKDYGRRAVEGWFDIDTNIEED